MPEAALAIAAQPTALLLAPVAALSMRLEVAAPTPGEAARQEATAGAQLLHRQGLRLGGLRLSMRYEDGSALTEVPALYRLPGAAAWLLGVANLQGRLVPVFDLALRAGLDLAATGAASPMLLVLGHGSEAAGILIEGMPQRLRLAGPGVEAAVVPPALRACVGRAHVVDGEQWLGLDVPALLRLLAEDDG